MPQLSLAYLPHSQALCREIFMTIVTSAGKIDLISRQYDRIIIWHIHNAQSMRACDVDDSLFENKIK